ncbi:sulfotransferase 1B1-like [Mercenaria mercenaria]|uniref:sulfotransferase 1B1-like n=1 Tax=Mercenaria mercenaria TaxID=6596 RepID=UPI00234EB627|nr:sulfotransferase 1B1-like [Mercenaria mercenaria]
MIRITSELPDGNKSEHIFADGITYTSQTLDIIPNRDLKSHIDNVCNLEIRDDDIYLATFPKSGTHWVWEILVMLRRGNAEYETKTKEAAFLDFQPPEIVEAIPSPRVLNCHYPCKLTPNGVFRKKVKIVQVMRNPKDVFVSFYHHHKYFDKENQIKSFQDYLPRMTGDYGLYHFYPWFQYVKEWERFSKNHPDQIINIYYEDLKENPVREIKKLDKFLDMERSEDLITKIANACNFENLKKADLEIKVQEEISEADDRPSPMYRKGQVGDWKNYFTVAQNEKVNTWLEDNFVDTELNFRYTL